MAARGTASTTRVAGDNFTRGVAFFAALRFTEIGRFGFSTVVRRVVLGFRWGGMRLVATLRWVIFFGATLALVLEDVLGAGLFFLAVENAAAERFNRLELDFAAWLLAAGWMAGMAFFLFVPGDARFMRNVG